MDHARPAAGGNNWSLAPACPKRFGQQFLVLITLLWVQVFLMVECFLIGK